MATVPDHKDFTVQAPPEFGDKGLYNSYEDFPRPPQFDHQVDSNKAGNDPLSIVQLVVELQVEKMRTNEAIRARDAVVHKLAEAYDTLRQKTSVLERLQAMNHDRSGLSSPAIGVPSTDLEAFRRREDITGLENTIKTLREEIKMLKEKATEPPPRYEDGPMKLDISEQLRSRPQSQPVNQDAIQRPGPRPIDSPLFTQSSPLFSSCSGHASPNPSLANELMTGGPELDGVFYAPQSEDTAEMVRARCSILASLPLPEEVPDDMLSPLIIPTPYTFNEFISSMSGPLRASLGSYRVFHALNTVWCPEREEHGYFYTPVFKCSTNPRVNTAHRWSAVDVINRMNKPTECFFNKDGTWYYAGVYTAFRLADLTTKEWSELSNEATQSIVKETIAGRKNTSPQNVYEITQLYAAGALKVACIALQCIGFNNTMYTALLEHTSSFAQSKTKNPTGGVGNAGPNAGTANAIHVSTPSMPTPTVMSGSTGVRSSNENWSGSSGSSQSPVIQIENGEGQLVATFNGMNLSGKHSGEKGESKK